MITTVRPSSKILTSDIQEGFWKNLANLEMRYAKALKTHTKIIGPKLH